MKLLAVRHAVAEEREAFAATGQEDAARPLTTDGRKRMKRIAQGLAREVPKVDVLATSDLARALQTAWILAGAYDDVAPIPIEPLRPDGELASLLAWLRQQDPRHTIAIVGHEPHLGIAVSWLLTGKKQSIISLKKGAACFLDLGEIPTAGQAALEWMATPGILRRLGG
jgi:phosphohistidine phosphatase